MRVTSACGGFIALHRSILDHPIFQAPDAWLKVWLYLLLTANWRDQKFRAGNDEITIRRGSRVTSLDSLACLCGVTRQQVRSALAYFKRAQMITLATTRRYTIITIVNYDSYQTFASADNTSDYMPDNTAYNTVTTHSEHSLNTVVTLIEKRNKEINKNIPSSADTDEGQRVARETPFSVDNPPFDPTSDEPWALDAPEAKPSLTDLQDELFAEFWQIYPRKVDRKPALKAFRRKATSEAAKNRIIAGLKRHLPAMLARDPQHVKYPASWLNADSFAEDPEPIQALNGSVRPGAAADDYPTFGARA